MDQIIVAKIVFSETKNLRPDSSAPTQLSAARCALATAINAANGVGYWPPVEPTAIELLDDRYQFAWIDCLAQAKQAPCTEAIGPVTVIEDQQRSVAKSLTALKQTVGAGPVATFGPFQDEQGDFRYLTMFNGQRDVKPGRYPRDSDHPVVTANDDAMATQARTPLAKAVARFRHGGALGLCLIIFVVALGWIGHRAYEIGATLSRENSTENGAWASADREQQFNARLDAAIEAMPGNPLAAADPQPTTLNAVTTAIDSQLGLDHALSTVFSASEAQSEIAQARAATSSAILASAAVKNLDTVQRYKLATDVAGVAGETVASDPLFTAVEASILWSWIFAAILFSAMIGAIGHMIRRTVLGAMIDARNRLSLSLVQMAGWSVLVFSLFYVTSLFLIGVSPTTSTLPVYNSGIWALLGLSIGTTATSRILLANKDGQGPPAAADGSAPASQLDKRDDPNAWSLYDLFLGEETSNSSTIDLTRLQQVIITIVLMIIFAGMTTAILSAIIWPMDPNGWQGWAAKAVPDLSNNETFLGLLAVSQGGYLLFKALPKQAGTTAATSAQSAP